MTLDYTKQGRKPSPQQIVADWKKGGRPDTFTVEYGETYAEFTQHPYPVSIFSDRERIRWHANGNGCRGVDRDAVVNLLNVATAPAKTKDYVG